MPKPLRPVPEGFRETFRDVSLEALARHYKTSCDIVRRWINECGGREKLSSANAIRPCPEGFAEMFGKLPIGAIADHYKAAPRTIERWRLECGLPASKVYNSRPIPADFAQVAPTMGKMELARHYKAGKAAVGRWLLQSGIKAKAAGASSKRTQAPFVRAVPGSGFKNHYGNLTPTRTSSIYDDAADIIRAKCPVYRCNEKGGYDPKGKFWRVGWSVITPDELLERAERYGSRAA